MLISTEGAQKEGIFVSRPPSVTQSVMQYPFDR